MILYKLFKMHFLRIVSHFARLTCEEEFYNQTFISVNERPIEFAFLFRQLTQSWPKTVLDVGTGTTALPHLMRTCGFHVTATDNICDYWAAGMTNRHFHIINDDITNTKLTESFDFISCISVLEHIRTHRDAMNSMFKLLNPGGRLVLTFPYNESNYTDNVYDLPESSVTATYPFITQAFSRQILEIWFSDNPFELLEQEYWQFVDGEYWTCGNRLIPPRRVGFSVRHQICCLLLGKPV